MDLSIATTPGSTNGRLDIAQSRLVYSGTKLAGHLSDLPHYWDLNVSNYAQKINECILKG